MTTSPTTTTAPSGDDLLATLGETAAVAAKADDKAKAKADKADATASARGFRGVDSETTKAVAKADALIATALAVNTAAVTPSALPAFLAAMSTAGDAVGTRGVAMTLALMIRAGEGILAAVKADRAEAGADVMLRTNITRSVAAAPAAADRAPVITKEAADRGDYGYGWGTLTDVIDSARLAHHVAAAYKADPTFTAAKAVIARARYLNMSAADQGKADAAKAKREADRETRTEAAKAVAAGATPDGSGATDDAAETKLTTAVESVTAGLTAVIARLAADGDVATLTALRDVVNAAIVAAKAVPAKPKAKAGNVIAIEAGKRAAEAATAEADAAATA